LTIDTPEEDLLLSQESMTSPIVLNDKLLTSAASPPVFVQQQLRSLLTPGDLEIYRAIQNGVTDRKLSNDPYTNFIDSDAISSILMDLSEQDYESAIPVNELLKMM